MDNAGGIKPLKELSAENYSEKIEKSASNQHSKPVPFRRKSQFYQDDVGGQNLDSSDNTKQEITKGGKAQVSSSEPKSPKTEVNEKNLDKKKGLQEFVDKNLRETKDKKADEVKKEANENQKDANNKQKRERTDLMEIREILSQDIANMQDQNAVKRQNTTV